MNKMAFGGNNIIKQLKIRPAIPDDFDGIIQLFESWAPHNWDTGYAKKYFR